MKGATTMMMDSAKGAAVRGSGLAARALRGTSGESKARSPFDRGTTARMPTGRENWNGRTSSEAVAPAESARSTTQRQEKHRFKQLAMIAAVAVAVAFVAIVYGVWMSATSAAAVEEATAGALPTLVATADIHAGDVLTPAMMGSKNIPQSFRVAAALDSGAWEAEGQGEAGRALVDIPAGSQITPGLVTGIEGNGHLAAKLGADMEAVTLAVDTETGLAGQVRAYDVVRIVSAENASSGSSLLRTVCERARVLATGEGANSGDGSYASVTVEVTPSEANAIREAQYAGRVSLVLISAQDVLEGGEEDGQDS